MGVRVEYQAISPRVCRQSWLFERSSSERQHLDCVALQAEPSGGITFADGWLWRMGCLVVALQAMHWLLMQSQTAQRRFAPASTAGFATLSQAFFTRRAGAPRALLQLPSALLLQAAHA